jgi:hypothetical protein
MMDVSVEKMIYPTDFFTAMKRVRIIIVVLAFGFASVAWWLTLERQLNLVPSKNAGI